MLNMISDLESYLLEYLFMSQTFNAWFRTFYSKLHPFTGWRETELATKDCCHSVTWPQTLWKQLCKSHCLIHMWFSNILQQYPYFLCFLYSLFIQSHMEWLDWHRSILFLPPRKHNCEFYRRWYVDGVGRMGLQTVRGQQQWEVTDGTPQSVQHISPLLRGPVGKDFLPATITAHQAKDWVLHWGRHEQEAQKVWTDVESLTVKWLLILWVIS